MNRLNELANPKEDPQVPKDYVHMPDQEPRSAWDLISYAIAVCIWLWILWLVIG